MSIFANEPKCANCGHAKSLHPPWCHDPYRPGKCNHGYDLCSCTEYREVTASLLTEQEDLDANFRLWLAGKLDAEALLMASGESLRWHVRAALVARAAELAELKTQLGDARGVRGGVALIAAERQRQMEAEGWSRSHDDSEHQSGELVHAAISYALHPFSNERLADDHRVPAGTAVPEHWPWDTEWWKPTPKDRVRELTKAGALIVAEIDRLTSATAPLALPESGSLEAEVTRLEAELAEVRVYAHGFKDAAAELEAQLTARDAERNELQRQLVLAEQGEQRAFEAFGALWADFNFSGCYDLDDLLNHAAGQLGEERAARDAELAEAFKRIDGWRNAQLSADAFAGQEHRRAAALEAEVTRLRAALEAVAQSYPWESYDAGETYGRGWPDPVLYPTNRRIAREALNREASDTLASSGGES